MAIAIKQALKEIFTAAMEEGGLLRNVVDSVLISVAQKFPDNTTNFIAIGNYQSTDVQTGDLTEKYRVYEIEIECGACLLPTEDNAEELAEERSERIAQIIRTIMKNNRKLECDSYPEGAAVSSSFLGAYSDWLIYEGNTCAMNRMRFTAKIWEPDEYES